MKKQSRKTRLNLRRTLSLMCVLVLVFSLFGNAFGGVFNMRAVADNTDQDVQQGEPQGTSGNQNPDNTDPGNTDPDNTNPESTDPESTNPGNTDPNNTNPGNTDPGNTDPENTDPDNTNPDNTDPNNTNPDTPAAVFSEEDVSDPEVANTEEWVAEREVSVTAKNFADFVYYLSTDKDLTVEKLNGESLPEETYGMVYEAADDSESEPAELSAKAAVRHYGDYYLFAAKLDAETGKVSELTKTSKHVKVANVGDKPSITISPSSSYWMTGIHKVTVDCESGDFTVVKYSKDGAPYQAVEGDAGNYYFNESGNGNYVAMAEDEESDSVIVSVPLNVKRLTMDELKETITGEKLTVTPESGIVPVGDTVTVKFEFNTAIAKHCSWQYALVPKSVADSVNSYESAAAVSGLQDFAEFTLSDLTDDIYVVVAADSENGLYYKSAEQKVIIFQPPTVSNFTEANGHEKSSVTTWANSASVTVKFDADSSDALYALVTTTPVDDPTPEFVMQNGIKAEACQVQVDLAKEQLKDSNGEVTVYIYVYDETKGFSFNDTKTLYKIDVTAPAEIKDSWKVYSEEEEKAIWKTGYMGFPYLDYEVVGTRYYVSPDAVTDSQSQLASILCNGKEMDLKYVDVDGDGKWYSWYYTIVVGVDEEVNFVFVDKAGNRSDDVPPDPKSDPNLGRVPTVTVEETTDEAVRDGWVQFRTFNVTATPQIENDTVTVVFFIDNGDGKYTADDLVIAATEKDDNGVYHATINYPLGNQDQNNVYVRAVEAWDAYVGKHSKDVIIPVDVRKIDSVKPVISELGVDQDNNPYYDTDENGNPIYYAYSKTNADNPVVVPVIASDWLNTDIPGSGIASIKYNDEAVSFNNPVEAQLAITHTDQKEMTYTITAKDAVGLDSDPVDVTVHYDGTNPIVESYSLRGSNTVNKFNSGTYCKNELELIVRSSDGEQIDGKNSGIDSMWLTYDAVDENGNVQTTKLGEQAIDRTASYEYSYKFQGDQSYSNVQIHVKDFAGNEGVYSLTDIANRDDVKSNNVIILPNGDLHLTAGINHTNNDDVTSYYNAESGTWFYGATVISFDFSVNDSVVGLNHAKLNLTGNGTDEALFDKEYDSDKLNQDRVDAAPSGSEEKIETIETKNYDDGLYTVSASAENNLGESDLIVDEGCAKDISFIIDKTIPVVNAVGFKPLSEASAIEDGVQDPAVDVVPTNYGFFFREGAEVTVYASDAFAENNAFASGVASITYRLVDRAGNEVKTESLPADGNGEITFTVDQIFKGQIYLTAYDNVGNKSAEKQLRMWMIVEDAAKHAEPETSSAVINMPAAVGTTDAEWGTLPLYNGAINPTIHLVGTFSGIDLERTQITVSYTPLGSTNTESKTYKGTDPVLTQSNVAMDENLITDVTLTLPISDIESNHIEISVEMHDNAGNTNQAENAVFAIDKTKPVIDVQYDNNAAENAKFFKADRTATITVTDWNFDPVKFSLSSENGMNGAWQHANGTNVWTNSVSYTTDGDYTFNATCTDRAGWTDEGVRYAEGTVAPTEFTVDKTAPVISYSFDNMNVRNGKYFNAGRTATIVINEHNFSYTVEGYSPVVSMTASIAEGATAVPGVNGWSMGGDQHSATVSFSRDGDYTMKIDYKDLAGNVAEQVSAPDFTIDMTAPTLTITGVEDHHAYKGEVAPSIVYHDINFDPNSPGITITGVKHPNVSNMNGVTSNDAFGGSFTAANIQVLKANDDVYTIVGSITDLAGNTTEQTLTFSVNRFGSTYDFDQQTEQLLNDYYSNAPQDVVIREINVDRVVSHSIVVSVNGESRTLVEGEDYTVTESSNGWMEYVYTIKASVFDKEGPYDIIVTSEDEAGNVNTNRTVKADGGVVEGVPVNFVLDETAPNILFDNVQNRHRYIASSREIYVRYDDNVAVATVEVFNNDELVARYEGEDLAEFENGEIPMTVTASNEWQNMVAVAYDAAGNQSGEAQVRFLLTSNIFVQFINSLWAILIALAVIALIIFFIIKRRRDDDDEEQQQTA